MAGKWILRVEGEPAKPGSYSVHLGWEDPQSGQSVELLAPCNSIDSFRQEIDRLTAELQQLFEEARNRVKSLAHAGSSVPKESPDIIWKQMQGFSTEAEMFAFFNSFDEPQRQQVAEYIFSSVNMFKGRGPIFSEHYDSTSHFLE